ncbi:universal stress protein [Flexivirga endophytica]|uniref:Universal stress protein n=1 Tax=Flexivirga endophytica TaxID=1849103 RepID=A0A916WVD8_9MICO|nr:universal stress protein [Flexivirga endophytica]GGB33065.1 universal stress protein [Flexivirga endophytica]GHB41054.1 universal stress protein [Flexivirga endophytica]
MILVGYDGSPQSAEAVRWAARAADLRSEALRVLSAVPLPVVPGIEYLPTTSVDDFSRAAEVLAQEGLELARAEGSADADAQGLSANPAHALVEASDHASLVVVGHRGHHELIETLLGSVGFAVAAHASCPVVVVRGEFATPARRIVVAVDGSESSLKAVDFAADAAHGAGATVEVVSVWGDPVLAAGLPVWDDPDEVQRAVTDDLERARTAALERHAGLTVTTEVARGQAAPEIARLADGADLLVVGSRGRGGFASLLLGSVSRRLVSSASCPVAVIR